nr:MAG TPA: hypothetical protein [Caudoviricetes sp.]
MAAAIKGQIDKFGNPLVFQGIKQNKSELDLISDPKSGDIYGVVETNKNYIWNSKEWIIYSDIMELDNYYNKEEINQKIENIQALPVGGTKGQVLTKQSETEGDANWEDIEANEVFVGNEKEAPSSAKIIVEDEDFEEGSTLSKAEVYVGAEEPTTGEKVWFKNDDNSIYVRNNGVYEEFIKKSEEVYSTEEQVIGTWIDGKPLYRKTIISNFEVPFVTQVTSYDIRHNISNIDKVVYAEMTDGLKHIPNLSMSGGTTTIDYVSSTMIEIRYINDSWSQRNWYITLEYTKTTD